MPTCRLARRAVRDGAAAGLPTGRDRLSERNVVLEEINMNEDDPTDVAHEQFVRRCGAAIRWRRRFSGPRNRSDRMTRDTIVGYWARRYSPHSTVRGRCGSESTTTSLVEKVAELFGEWEGDRISPAPTAAPNTGRSVRVRRRDTEQAHLVFGSPRASRGRRTALRPHAGRPRSGRRDVVPPVPRDPGEEGLGVRRARFPDAVPGHRCRRPSTSEPPQPGSTRC